MQLRLNNLSQLQQQTFGILIVGGGINGAVSAASLAAKNCHGIMNGVTSLARPVPTHQISHGAALSTWRTSSSCGEQTQQEPQYPGRGLPIHSARNQISDHYK